MIVSHQISLQGLALQALKAYSVESIQWNIIYLL